MPQSYRNIGYVLIFFSKRFESVDECTTDFVIYGQIEPMRHQILSYLSPAEQHRPSAGTKYTAWCQLETCVNHLLIFTW